MRWVILVALVAGAADAAEPSVLTRAPSRPTVSLPEALALESDGDDAGAIAALDALIGAQPAWELPRLEMARLLLKTGGALGRAEAHLDAALQQAPHNPRAWYLRGVMWEERDDRRQAVQAYEQAVKLRGSYEDARLRLGTLWFDLGDTLKAEMHYRYLARLKPEWVQVRLLLAEVLERQERPLDAERELLAARDYQPTSPLVLRRLADFYTRTGRPQLAERVRKSMEAPPKRKMRELKPSRR